MGQSLFAACYGLLDVIGEGVYGVFGSVHTQRKVAIKRVTPLIPTPETDTSADTAHVKSQSTSLLVPSLRRPLA
ncbi:hypothetical protein D9756_006412 [Leucocoprinus leucothites]|uniref:Uncharacterized protein n=1 Tax=Leucocoprinus leucothites TaxID=201217 RepID=A0A8H5G2K6_9AGAR|nr:hypothetical protein D9756_006412 [Leucoagaricus leucothites]